MDSRASFRVEGARRGARQTLPLAIGDFAVGIVFGIGARHAGIDLLGALLMSGLVSAGTSQFVALGIWTRPLPVVSTVVTTMLVNLRYLIMSAGISPWMAKLPAFTILVTSLTGNLMVGTALGVGTVWIMRMWR